MRRMGLKSAIVVCDGYHIFRVKKILEHKGWWCTARRGRRRKERVQGALAVFAAGVRLPAVAGGDQHLTMPRPARHGLF